MATTVAATSTSMTKVYGTTARWCGGSEDNSAWMYGANAWSVNINNYNLRLQVKPVISNVSASYAGPNDLVGSNNGGYEMLAQGLTQSYTLTITHQLPISITNITYSFSNPERVELESVTQVGTSPYAYAAYKFRVKSTYVPVDNTGGAGCDLGTVTSTLTMDNGEVITTPSRKLHCNAATPVTITKTTSTPNGDSISGIMYSKDNGATWTSWTTASITSYTGESMRYRATIVKGGTHGYVNGKITANGVVTTQSLNSTFTLTSSSAIVTASSGYNVEFYAYGQ
jgi:hypothetical protein